MNSALNLILMTRDKDLRRWGRFSAVLMIFLGCFLICAVFYSYRLVDSRLEPALESARESEQKIIERITDEKVRTALSAGSEAEWQSTNHLLDGARAVILGGGIGFAIISFYTAALAWRSYELASTGPEPSEPNKQAESGSQGILTPSPHTTGRTDP
jgi:hypothetical protein